MEWATATTPETQTFYHTTVGVNQRYFLEKDRQDGEKVEGFYDIYRMNIYTKEEVYMGFRGSLEEAKAVVTEDIFRRKKWAKGVKLSN